MFRTCVAPLALALPPFRPTRAPSERGFALRVRRQVAGRVCRQIAEHVRRQVAGRVRRQIARSLPGTNAPLSRTEEGGGNFSAASGRLVEGVPGPLEKVSLSRNGPVVPGPLEEALSCNRPTPC
eukprot:3369300-Rhodomonas_salina.3